MLHIYLKTAVIKSILTLIKAVIVQFYQRNAALIPQNEMWLGNILFDPSPS